MKATLEFDLPEDDCALKAAEKGQDALAALRDLDNYLRAKIKWDDLSLDQAQAFNECREKFWEVLGDWDIDLDD